MKHKKVQENFFYQEQHTIKKLLGTYTPRSNAT